MSQIIIGRETLDQTQIRKRLPENGMYLQFLDKITYNDCIIAVNENHMAFQYVPIEYQTVELCRLALYDTNFQMLRFIKKYDNPEIFDLCLNLTPNRLLSFLFNECIIDPTEEMCCKLLQREITNIRILPNDKRTAKICNLILQNLSTNPKLIREIPNPTTDILQKAININKSCQQYLDFDRYKITLLFDGQTKQLHNIEPTLTSKLGILPIESYIDDDGHHPILTNSKPQTCVCYEDIKTGSFHLIKNSQSITAEIYKYIKTHFGIKNINYIQTNPTFETIINDSTFEGAFYQEIEEKYELYIKTITTEKSWLSTIGLNKVITKHKITKIRVYSYINIE